MIAPAVALASFVVSAFLAAFGSVSLPVMAFVQAIVTTGVVTVVPARLAASFNGPAASPAVEAADAAAAPSADIDSAPSPPTPADEVTVTADPVATTPILGPLDSLLRQRSFENELDHDLAAARDEAAVLSVAYAALRRSDPTRPVELHLVDADRPVLRLALTSPHRLEDALVEDITATSPPVVAWSETSEVVRTATTLAFRSSTAPDACHHLRARAAEACSAICVPLVAHAQVIGVLYATGPDGVLPPEGVVARYESIARRLAPHLAAARAEQRAAETNPVRASGVVVDRTTIIDRLRSLIDEDRSYSIGVADIDHFRAYNQLHGAEAGDAALRLLGHTILRSLRPTDLVGRIGGEELLMIFPDTPPDAASRAVERVRESLVLAHASGDAPGFTCSYGLVRPTGAAPIDQVLTHLFDALGAAKRRGRNRVVTVDHDESAGSSEQPA
jgi:diguanylate cyclase (GGDEF)-like protein